MSLQPRPLEPRGESGGLATRTAAWWLLLGALAYLVLGLLGRSTVLGDNPLSLVWPAAGASMLLFGVLPPRWWGAVAIVLAAAGVVLNLMTDVTGRGMIPFTLSNLTGALTAILVLRALSPGLLGAGGTRPLEHLRDFWSVLAACTAGAFAAAATGTTARRLLLEQGSTVDLFVWWGRNTVGSIVVFSTAVLGMAAWMRARERRRAGLGSGAPIREAVRRRGVEALLLSAVTLAIYAVVFVRFPDLPVAYPLLLPTVWAGMRFSPLAVAGHSIVVSAGVVFFTVRDEGPFADPEHWGREVLISQVFLGLIFCLGLLLALGRTERLALTSTLEGARASSESQARLLSTIIDTMHDGVTVLDETGKVLRRNPSGAAMLRTSPHELDLVDQSRFRFLGADGRPLLRNELPWVRVFSGDGVVTRDLVVEFVDGSPSRTLAVNAFRLPAVGPQGVRQALVVYHDATAERAQQSELESFAAVVAHDLLGPLGVVDGWSEMLVHDLDLDGALSVEDAAPKLDRIRTASAGMRKLIEDLLDSSTSRDPQLRAAPLDLETLAQSIADQHVEWASGPRPRIEVGSLPRVYADATLLRQVLDNLIGNAVKYVVPGEVPVVRVHARRIDDLVEVTVADEGVGIPADQRDRIFEAFHRAHAGKGYAGHGIGLSVCKRIVERHGGRISARPPEGGRGTRIVFTLPAADAVQH